MKTMRTQILELNNEIPWKYKIEFSKTESLIINLKMKNSGSQKAQRLASTID